MIQLMQAITTDLQSFVNEKEIGNQFDLSRRCKYKSAGIQQKALTAGLGIEKKVYEASRRTHNRKRYTGLLQTKLNPLLEEKKSEILKNVGISTENPELFE